MDGLIIPGITDALVIPVAFDWPSPDRILEAIGTGTAKRAQRANRAGQDQIDERFKLEKATQTQLAARLDQLKTALAKRLLSDDGSVTDFRRFTLQQLTADVDRLITQTQADLAATAERDYKAADQLGVQAAQEPLAAAQLHVTKALPGLDSALVQAAFGNTVDLLTPPMQQFATQVKVALRGVAMAGDNKSAAIGKLRAQIQGQGFDNAAYRAERIIRTELGRVFNQATYERLVTLSKEFPFLRKGWRATADSRTRQGHREAGATYSRGHGIKISDRFSLNVYDERPKQTPKLLGVATLLYPVDPGVKPEGRVGAAATIMCRCNGFVDFDLADFAQFTQAKVATALADVKAPAPPKPEPGPKPAPAPKVPKVKPVKVPKVKVPTAADVTPAASPKHGPQGPKVSAAADLTPANPGYKTKALNAANVAKVRKGLDLIDSVHGDGALQTIPVTGVASRYRSKAGAYYQSSSDGRPLSLGFGNGLMKNSPNMTVFHEVGHWLDQQGVGARRYASTASFDQEFAGGSATVRAAVEKWREAVKNSQAIQTLERWRGANIPADPRLAGYGGGTTGNGHTYGDGTVPLGVQRAHVNYLLGAKEVWARSYAQYVATNSGNAAALKELQNMQAASQSGVGPVARTTPYSGTQLGLAPKGGGWDYPWQWSDEDFKPIAAAFDGIMGALGWRK